MDSSFLPPGAYPLSFTRSHLQDVPTAHVPATVDTKELRLVTDALGMVAAAGCPQQPILVLQPSAVSSWRSANSPRFIMGRKLRGGDEANSVSACLFIHIQRL